VSDAAEISTLTLDQVTNHLRVERIPPRDLCQVGRTIQAVLALNPYRVLAQLVLLPIYALIFEVSSRPSVYRVWRVCENLVFRRQAYVIAD
jgi:hypothetical protein